MGARDLGIGRPFDNVWDVVIVADVDSGRFILWNPAAMEIFGHSLSTGTFCPPPATPPKGRSC